MQNLKLLRPDRKIINCYNGSLQIEQKNVQEILQESSQHNDLPVAFLAVIGPPQSGKSFLTNVLVKCLEQSGEDDWMEHLIRDGEFEEGFHFGSVGPSEKLFHPGSDSSGIYLWPTPFLMKKEEGDELLVWILHYHVPEDSSSFDKDVNAIEKCLALACSRMMEIVAGNKEFHLGSIKRTIASTNINSSKHVCNSLVLVDLSDEGSKSGLPTVLSGSDAREGILEMKMTMGKGRALNRSMLDEFTYVNLVRMKTSVEPLHDQNGKFNEKEMANLSPTMKALTTTILEEGEVLPKKGRDGQPIRVSEIQEYLSSCVDQVNQSKSSLVVRKQEQVMTLQTIHKIQRSSSSSSSASSLGSAQSDSNSVKVMASRNPVFQSPLFPPYNNLFSRDSEVKARNSSSLSSSSLESCRAESDSELKTPSVEKTEPGFANYGIPPVPLPRSRSASVSATNVQSPTKTTSFLGTDTSSEDSDSSLEDRKETSPPKPTFLLGNAPKPTPATSVLATFDLLGSNNNNVDHSVTPNYSFHQNVVEASRTVPRNVSSSYYSSSSESSSYDSDIDEALNSLTKPIETPVPIFQVENEMNPIPHSNPSFPFEGDLALSLDTDTEQTSRKEEVESIRFSEQYLFQENVVTETPPIEKLVLATSHPLENRDRASTSNTMALRNEDVPIGRSISQDLGSLIVRLSYNHITIGTSLGGEFTLLQNPKGESSTPLIVGINNYGKLVYGTDAMRQCFSHNPPLSHWWITEFFANERFNSCRYPVTLNIGGREVVHEISVEFLLGYLLRSLKEYAESLLSGCFSRVVITVPFWFCSTHRLQVKDAAAVAGFLDAKLINEESAAAYSRAFGKRVTGVIISTGNVLVLSENYGVITAILYSYSNQNPKKTTMLAYAFSNDWMDIKKKMESKPEADETKAQMARMKAKTNLVSKVCTGLFKQKFQHNKKDPMDVVFLTSSDLKDVEEVEWLQAFEKVVKNKGYEYESGSGVEGSCFTIMLGASLITQMHHRECMQEYLAIEVNRCSHGDQKSKKLFPKNVFPTLPLKTNSDDIVLPKAKEITFFQQGILGEHKVFVGEIIVGPGISNHRKVYPILEISSEGIISLTEVKSDPGRFRPVGAIESIMDYIWNVPNISDFQKKEISGFIDILMQDEENRRFVSEA